MKKPFLFFMFVISFFFLNSCGLLAVLTLDNPLDNAECMTPEDLTSFMNNQFPETTFKFISTDFKKDKYNYKERIVYLNAANLPGKTITVIQSYHSSRMTYASYDFFFCTDYIFYKNENEIYEAFKKLYSPLTEGLKENQWKLVLKPDINSFHFYTTNEYSKITKNNYLSIEKIIQTTRYEAYLLINKDFSAGVQNDYNSFMKDLQKKYEDEGRNHYGYYDLYVAETKERTTPYADFHCYYSTSLLASEVNEKELTETDFVYKQGVIVPEPLIESEQE